MNKQKEKETEKKDVTQFYNKLLRDEFSKETDRGAVILAASLFDIQLESLLKTYLVPDTSSSDQLFEGASAPLSTFSARILICYRLGLISKNFARDLNLIRKIRNEFAHNIHGCSFEHSSVVSRVHELSRSSNMSSKFSNVRGNMPSGTRGEFLINCSWMLWNLAEETKSIDALTEANLEFGYLDFDENNLKEDEEAK
jgi:DNA-binding MltR family transcriptional regulator